MTPKEKAIDIRDAFIDVTKNFHPYEGWVKDLSSAKLAGIIALELLKQERMNSMDYKFWDEVQAELEKL